MDTSFDANLAPFSEIERIGPAAPAGAQERTQSPVEQERIAFGDAIEAPWGAGLSPRRASALREEGKLEHAEVPDANRSVRS